MKMVVLRLKGCNVLRSPIEYIYRLHSKYHFSGLPLLKQVIPNGYFIQR